MLNKPATRTSQIDAALAVKLPQYPGLCVGRTYANESYRIYSDNEETALFLAGLPQTSLDVFRLSSFTVGQWVEAVEHLITEGIEDAGNTDGNNNDNHLS